MRFQRSIRACTILLILASAITLISTVLITDNLFLIQIRRDQQNLRKMQSDALCIQMNDWLADVATSLRSLSYSAVFSRYADTETTLRFEDKAVVQKLLDLNLEPNRSVQSLRLCLANGQSLCIGANYISQYMSFQTHIADEGLLDECFRTGATIFSPCYSNTSAGDLGQHIFVLVPLRRIIYQKCYGALVAYVDVQSYVKSLSSDEVFSIYYRGDLISDSSNRLYPQSLRQYNLVESERNDWRIVLYYQSSTFSHQLIIISLVFAAVASLTHILLLLAVNRITLRPLENLCAQIRQMQDANETIIANGGSSNEIEYLAVSLNDALQRFCHSNQLRLDMQQQLHSAKLARMAERVMMMQTQINPHFLYNNLECIRGMAAENCTDSIRQITSAMAVVYRYCIKHAPLASLNEELQCAKAFFRIIELRYDRKYTLEIHVDNDAQQCILPCMTLQPIIENAIQHGFVGMQTGRIIIRSEDKLLHIEDNGHAMPHDTMKQFNDSLSTMNVESSIDFINEQKHIGLKNINMRLKILVNAEYCVHLQQGRLGGLTVTLPLTSPDAVCEKEG